jgi:hypothetical protein
MVIMSFESRVPLLAELNNLIISGLERGAEYEYGHHLLPLHRRRILWLPQIRQDIPSQAQIKLFLIFLIFGQTVVIVLAKFTRWGFFLIPFLVFLVNLKAFFRYSFFFTCSIEL